MNIIRIFEKYFIDAPTVDIRLTPKWTQKHSIATLSKLESSVGDWLLLARMTTS